MGEREARTQGAPIAALWGRLRTTHRAAQFALIAGRTGGLCPPVLPTEQRGQAARASFRKELSRVGPFRGRRAAPEFREPPLPWGSERCPVIIGSGGLSH